MDETPINVPQVEAPKSERDEIDERMQNELTRLSIQALQGMLETLGAHADPDVPKGKLVEAIMAIRKARFQDADKIVAESTSQIAADDDPIVTMKFHNSESPGADIEFVYDGGKGFPKNADGKVMPLPKFHFFEGRTYKVPMSVYKHMNSLMVAPDNVVNVNSEGFIQSLYTGDTPKKNRFSCTLELTDDQVRRITVKGN